jgi:inorganic pyrophosphatase
MPALDVRYFSCSHLHDQCPRHTADSNWSAARSDGEERNDRILGVALHSYDHQHLRHIRDVSKTLLDQVEEFFICYNKQRGKKFKVDSLHGPRRALKCLQKSMAAAEKKA